MTAVPNLSKKQKKWGLSDKTMKKFLNKHDKIVWDIALKEILRLKSKPAKDCWFQFNLKKRVFIVYRKK